MERERRRKGSEAGRERDMERVRVNEEEWGRGCVRVGEKGVKKREEGSKMWKVGE